jgi:hypothetical protein
LSLDKLHNLVGQAKSIIVANSKPDKTSIWRAYVSLEYAILDLKLRQGIEGNPPPKPVKSADLAALKLMIGSLDPSSIDKKKLLYDLRSCRDVVKALVASYEDVRSTTS